MKKMLGPDPGLRVAMEKILGPPINLQEQMKKMLGPDPGLRVAMIEASLASQQFLKQGDQLYALQREAQKWTQKVLKQHIGQPRMQETFAGVIKSQKMISEQF